ncbi:Glutamate/aspartate import solute-binding protein [compost metagenome]|jgi:glutamate/aspartate transport system substrate-binding protein|uniref:Glutamate/aspartate ABC transport system permease protein GltI n=1 Tax=Cupriavidus necator (strain ATCC 43291 / DSM 13513 / CCUG 52238 / LMG 8453 / N-1) TaxID=1042878 RepID=G0EVF5_CUPNN|nr:MULTISPECIES: glutamate/aspartate ABC transporter substrate-binding protein [Cupriavidus]AEI75859.1 glutamate/aspartate ABC transport system permease protein GltI [Cupriavidus necator N-1]KAI3599881.1 Glutamate/aspartate ABC transporter, substrate-binding protein GltI [Cupriavidus necator H850]MDX6012002.1 glutamate/aspartate ABC transporter substrate-binding protein [Cupriavidus necator]QUN28902.1 glutamate/aspartate ABC transporter substrate-binding protein [Cupriavidus sp. KK10]
MNFAKLAALMIAAGVMCGTAQAAEQLTGTLKKIKDTGVITLGVRESSIPFNYNLGGVRQVGYSYDINMKIVEAIKDQLKLPNLQVKEIPITSQNRITLLQNGTIDIECGSTTNNLERQKQVAFTNSIFIIGTRIMVKKDAGIKDWADLKGKNIVTTAGTTSERLLRKMNDDQKLGMNIISTKDHGQSFLTLESGRAVAFMMDDALLYGERAKAKNPADWIVVGKPQSRESYGCMIRKDDPQFKKLSDTVITGMMKDGSVNTLYTKWFMQPVPPKGLNLDFPLSEDMKALIKAPNDKALD